MAAPTTAQLKSFDYVQDVTKTLITLAIGVVTITVSFLKDIFPHAPSAAKVVLAVGWGLYALSVPCGIATLLNLTGRLPNLQEGDEGIYSGPVRFFSGAQVVSFVLALIATIYFGAASF